MLYSITSSTRMAKNASDNLLYGDRSMMKALGVVRKGSCMYNIWLKLVNDMINNLGDN